MAQYFETAVRYAQMQEDGKMKKVTEAFIVDAVNFTEAEARTMSAGKEYISGEFEVIREKPVSYDDIIVGEDSNEYYKVKVSFITLEEKSGKEKKIAHYMLVGADSIDDANNKVKQFFKSSVIDYTIDTITLKEIKKYIAYEPKK